MSQINSGEGKGMDKQYWRSLGQLDKTPEFQQHVDREFPENASVLEDKISRRTFVKLMTASAALAGMTGCSIRRPVQKVHPYVKSPENLIPGKPNFYASAFQLGDDVLGVLVESHEGRPTKLEGNPEHSQSLGAASVFAQASVLNLYDPDRIKEPKFKGEILTRSQVVSHLQSEVAQAGGEGVYILSETQVSPTTHRLLKEVQAALPQVTVLRYDAVNRDEQIEATKAVYGSPVVPLTDFEKASVVVSFGSDFLGVEPQAVVNTKGFSKRRDPEHPKGMNRFYAFESRFTATGARADHRIPVKPSEIEAALWVVADALFAAGLSASDALKSEVKQALSTRKVTIEKAYIQAIVDDVLSNRGASAFVVGMTQSRAAHALAAVLNDLLNSPVVHHALPFGSSALYRQTGLTALKQLSDALEAGAVRALLVLGGNPVYAAPADIPLNLKKAGLVAQLSQDNNETLAHAQLIIPESHYLESWSDVQAVDGSVSIVQPLISPMYHSFTAAEVLAALAGKEKTDFELVKETWSSTSEKTWKSWLHSGVAVPAQSGGSLSGSQSAAATLIRASKAKKTKPGFELGFDVSPSLYDGRFANNGWLQELPEPISKLTWDNALFINPVEAKAQGVKTGDQVVVKLNQQALTLPVMEIPGQAMGSASVFLGYGRKVVGRVGGKSGFDVRPLRQSASPYVSTVTLQKTDGHYKLASTQEHWSLEGRPAYREATVSEYKADPEFAKEMVEHPPLVSSWKEKQYDTGYQWGMSIDLGKCTGCNACITACQAENNIPIVGKKEVLNGREMHWIRIDRYFSGREEAPRIVHQPVNCLQCEMAPCEQVCPVAATTHSKEGLNDMTYNRCIGTKYCANNCPVKVRRFNFFDYHQSNPQSVPKERKHFFDYMRESDKTVQMQFNPDVTVRMRGIMEKCTYCVQRINEGKIRAANDNRTVVDGEIITACEQTCPSDAIVFGNILDADSRIAKLRAKDRRYDLLAELNLRPRTTFLAAIRNPHPKLVYLEKERA
ncbi:MAG: TAT-variant-translocated molybdopterin oxidoreductase [Candidatus Margulisiibacteriota bacterium]